MVLQIEVTEWLSGCEISFIAYMEKIPGHVTSKSSTHCLETCFLPQKQKF